MPLAGAALSLCASVVLAVWLWITAGHGAVVIGCVVMAVAGAILSLRSVRTQGRADAVRQRQIERLERRLRARDDALEAAMQAIHDAASRPATIGAAMPGPRPASIHPNHRDPMTDVPNRAWFEEFVRQLATDPSAQQCEIVLVELQHIPQIVSVHGASAGELTLRTVAQRLRNDLRSSDRIARVGNVTFALALETRVGGDQASDIARRLVQRATKPIALPDGSILAPVAMHKLVSTRDASDLPDDAQSVTDRTVVRAQRSARGNLPD